MSRDPGRVLAGARAEAGGWMIFIEALGRHGADHWTGASVATPFVERHVLVDPMPCPDGSSPDALSVWMLWPDGTVASFVTAYPA